MDWCTQATKAMREQSSRQVQQDAHVLCRYKWTKRLLKKSSVLLYCGTGEYVNQHILPLKQPLKISLPLQVQQTETLQRGRV